MLTEKKKTIKRRVSAIILHIVTNLMKSILFVIYEVKISLIKGLISFYLKYIELELLKQEGIFETICHQ